MIHSRTLQLMVRSHRQAADWQITDGQGRKLVKLGVQPQPGSASATPPREQEELDQPSNSTPYRVRAVAAAAFPARVIDRCLAVIA